MQLSDVHIKAIEIFNLDIRRKTTKGWIIGATCPFCKKNDKFGIRFNQIGRYDNHISYNCFRGSCGERGGEYLLFREVGQEAFLKDGKYVKHVEQIENKIKAKRKYIEEPLDLSVPKASLPLGWRRVMSDPYLDSRGFEKWQYDQYKIGRTRLFKKLKDYVVISIEEGGENKGYVARLVWSKERINQYKEDTGTDPLRYRNEGGIDFAKLLYGIDEITEETTTVVIVEGFFDKSNVDKQLQLNLSPKTKCLVSFGKKLSLEQIEKLKRVKNIKNVIIAYDPDAVEEVKKYGTELEPYFKVFGVFIDNPDEDVGDMGGERLGEVLDTMEPIKSFCLNRVQVRKLKG